MHILARLYSHLQGWRWSVVVPVHSLLALRTSGGWKLRSTYRFFNCQSYEYYWYYPPTWMCSLSEDTWPPIVWLHATTAEGGLHYRFTCKWSSDAIHPQLCARRSGFGSRSSFLHTLHVWQYLVTGACVCFMWAALFDTCRHTCF